MKIEFKKFIFTFAICIFLLSNWSFGKDTENNIEDIDINSRSCVVLDRKSKTILFGKNENKQVKMASTTKIMTAIVIIENYDLNKEITVSKKAAGTGGSRLGLRTGDKITVHDLLYGLLLRSGNDAAVALAETVGGSIEGFAELMNQKAKELNLKNTHFESPHGLDSDGHYTTAYELALITDYALQNSTFAKIVGTKNYTITINGYPKALTNTNELLGNLNGVYGVKTGFTNGANRCLVSSCKRGDMDIICVVLGADTKNFRTQDSIKLIEYAFANYEHVNIKEIADKELSALRNKYSSSFFVDKGISNKISFEISNIDTPILPIKKDLVGNITTESFLNTNLIAPVHKDEILGYIKIVSNNNVIANFDIICKSEISKRSVIDYLKLFMQRTPQIFEELL